VLNIQFILLALVLHFGIILLFHLML